MKLDDAIEECDRTWSHYTAWQIALKYLRRFRNENKQLRAELKIWKRD